MTIEVTKGKEPSRTWLSFHLFLSVFFSSSKRGTYISSWGNIFVKRILHLTKRRELILTTDGGKRKENNMKSCSWQNQNPDQNPNPNEKLTSWGVNCLLNYLFPLHEFSISLQRNRKEEIRRIRMRRIFQWFAVSDKHYILSIVYIFTYLVTMYCVLSSQCTENFYEMKRKTSVSRHANYFAFSIEKYKVWEK